MISFTVPKIDWVEKKKLFFGFSLLLILAGGISLLGKGGPEYGIDFRGGTLLQVKFAEDVNIDELRSLLSEEGLTCRGGQRERPSASDDLGRG